MNKLIFFALLALYVSGVLLFLWNISDHNVLLIIFGTIAPLPLIAAIVYFINNWIHKEPRWNWNQIEISAKDLAETIFNKKGDKFLFGTAVAAHQVEGDNKNQWTDWEDIPGKIKHGDKSGKACEHLTRYKEDIALMKGQLGVDTFRFSIEWSRFQPNSENDEFEKDAIQHYHDVIDECLKQKLTPMVTFHHFSNPIWFQKMGSFEKEENLIHFENFCEKICKEYKDKVKIWCTINEPEIYTLCGYLDGNTPGCFPPGQVNLFTAIKVLKHLMIAHTNVYGKLKMIDPDCMIGLAKNYCRVRTFTSWNPIEFVSAWGFNTFRDTCILRYLKTGYFYIPFLVNYYNPNGKKSLDYLGMNYYGDCWLYGQYGFKIGNEWREEDKQYMTDMDYPMYAEGFHEGLKTLSKVGVPIIVTENGCADAKDVGLRETWIKRYLYALVKAMQDGVDVRGYTYWSFCDNFEWSHGFKMRFGLYHVDYKTQERTLRDGSKFLVDVVKEYKKLIL